MVVINNIKRLSFNEISVLDTILNYWKKICEKKCYKMVNDNIDKLYLEIYNSNFKNFC